MNREMNQKTDKFNRRRGRFVRGLVRSAETALAELEDSPDLPEGMGYFINIMRDVFVRDEGGHFSNLCCHQGTNNRKVIGTYCVMVPEELIYAAAQYLSGSAGEAMRRPAPEMSLFPAIHARW